jgi:hypothetical protein
VPVESVPRTLLDLDFEFARRSDGPQLAVEFFLASHSEIEEDEFALSCKSELVLVCVKKALSILLEIMSSELLEIMSSDFNVPRFDPIAQGAGYDREQSSGVDQ